MIAALTALTMLVGAEPLAVPDTFVVPLWADTVTEIELQMWPPGNAVLPVYFMIAWGDGDTTTWTGPVTERTDISRYHKYLKLGDFEIRVAARDNNSRTSDWSKPIPIKVSASIQKWKFETSDPIVGSPALDLHGNIYIGDESGTVYSVRPDGSQRWTYVTHGPVYASALVDRNRVYVLSVDSSMYCLDTTGKLIWSLPLGDEFYSAPALGLDGTIYAGSDQGLLFAVSPAGKLRWKFKTGDEISSSPTIGANGLVYATSDSVYCLDARGRRHWTFGTPGGDYFFASAVPDAGGVVYVGNLDGNLYCIGPDGRLRWRAPVTDGDEIRPEVSIGPDGQFYFGSDGDYLFRMRPGGQPAVIYEAVDILIATAAISDKGTVYFLPDDGTVYSMTAAGRVLWRLDVATSDKQLFYTSAPTIAPDGTVYVGSWDGGLYAFRGDGPPAATWWPQYRHDAQHTGRAGLARKR